MYSQSKKLWTRHCCVGLLVAGEKEKNPNEMNYLNNTNRSRSNSILFSKFHTQSHKHVKFLWLCKSWSFIKTGILSFIFHSASLTLHMPKCNSGLFPHLLMNLLQLFTQLPCSGLQLSLQPLDLQLFAHQPASQM